MIDLILAAALVFTWDPPTRGAELEARLGAGPWQQVGLGLAPLSIPPGAMPGPGLIEYRATAQGGEVPTASLYECASRSATCTPPGEAPTAWVTATGCGAAVSDDGYEMPGLCSLGGVDPASARYEVSVEGYGGSVLVEPAALQGQVLALPASRPDAVLVASWDLGTISVPVSVRLTAVGGAPQIDQVRARGVVATPRVCDGEQDRFRVCCQQVGGCQ